MYINFQLLAPHRHLEQQTSSCEVCSGSRRSGGRGHERAGDVFSSVFGVLFLGASAAVNEYFTRPSGRWTLTADSSCCSQGIPLQVSLRSSPAGWAQSIARHQMPVSTDLYIARAGTVLTLLSASAAASQHSAAASQQGPGAGSSSDAAPQPLLELAIVAAPASAPSPPAWFAEGVAAAKDAGRQRTVPGGVN